MRFADKRSPLAWPKWVSAIAVIAMLGLVPLRQPMPRAEADAPFAVEYYYKVKWGHFSEFLELYKKNHYPILKAQMGSRLVDFTAYAPLHHGDGRADWTFATELVFKDDAQFMLPSPAAQLAPEMFSDLDVFDAEERRRKKEEAQVKLRAQKQKLQSQLVLKGIVHNGTEPLAFIGTKGPPFLPIRSTYPQATSPPPRPSATSGR